LKLVNDFYNIPRTSIMEHVDSKRKSRKLRSKEVLTNEEEVGLLDYLDSMLA